MRLRPLGAAIAVLLLLGACSPPEEPAPSPVPAVAAATPSPSPSPSPSPTPSPTPTPEPWQHPEVDRAALPVADTWAVIPEAPEDPDPHAVPSGQLAAPVDPAGALLYDAPRGTPFAVLPVVQVVGDAAYPVVAEDGEWYQVLLSARRGLPSQAGHSGVNNAVGWVLKADVATSETDYLIVADLTEQTVTLYQGDEVLAATEAGVGTPRTPTPPGRTFVMSVYQDPAYTYSRWFIALGTHSPTMDTFSGGPAPVAIHAFATYSGEISNGCLRIPDAVLDAFTVVPNGTPVVVVP